MKLRFVRYFWTLSLTLMLILPASAQNATPDSGSQTQELPPNRALAFYPEETGQGTYISVELAPGQSAVVSVVLGNAGEIPQQIRTYSINAGSAINGGFEPGDYGAEPNEVTSWLTYPETEYEFDPGEGVVTSVQISVPESAVPGEYVTGIAAEQVDAFEVPGSSTLSQRVRWSVPVLIVVPGEPIPEIKIGDAQLQWSGEGLYATIVVSNPGNVIIRPTGSVQLLDADNNVIGVSNVEMDSVYTGTETTFIVGWFDVPESESYSLKVDVKSEDGEATALLTIPSLTAKHEGETEAAISPLQFSMAEFSPATGDIPPTVLNFQGEITNNGEQIENARVSIVTFQDGVEVDRYPIMQAVTLPIGTTPIEARYTLPGGFTDGTYTFEVTIETGTSSSQTILADKTIDYNITVGD